MKTNVRWQVFPLYRLNQQVRAEMPGLLLLQPPARAARSRREDQLVVYVALSGRQAVEDERVRAMVARAAETFYQTSGSVTTALRAAAAALNEALRRMNAAHSGEGQFLVGRAALAALRREAVYLLLSGPVQVFALTADGLQTLQADERAARGLGVSQAVPHSLARVELATPMKLALCAQAPAEWQAFFASEKATTPAAVMADSLLQLNGQDVHAVLLDVQSAEETPPPDALSAAVPQLPAPPKAEPPRKRPLSPEQQQALAEQALNRLQRWRGRGQRRREALRRFAARLLPFADENEGVAFLSQRLLLLLAVLIPVLVAFSASSVYMRRGLYAQARALYAQADAQAVQARLETNPVLQREAWREVLGLLAQADALVELEESRTLRQEALNALDALDGVLRVSFAAMDLKLPPNARITALAANEEALFLLDAANNAVYRASRIGTGYRLDEAFFCQGEGQIGELQAIVAAPGRKGVLAFDGGGRMLQCTLGAEMVVHTLPATNRGDLQVDAVAWLDGFIYVLDRNARAVWIYPPDEAGDFTRPPLYFFDAKVPDVSNVQAMTVYGGELFLLNQDGSFTVCQYSLLQTVPNRCEEQVILRDTRPGYTDAVRIPETDFTQLQVTQPPNTALLALDGAHSAVYRFSPQTRLLQNVLKGQADAPPDGQPWTAFVVTPDAVLVVATGNQVYFAPHIP